MTYIIGSKDMRYCSSCGVPITDRAQNAKYCKQCARRVARGCHNKSRRKWRKRYGREADQPWKAGREIQPRAI